MSYIAQMITLPISDEATKVRIVITKSKRSENIYFIVEVGK